MTRVLVLTAIDFEARTLARHLGLGRVARTPWPHFTSGALELACVGVRACRLRDRQHAFRPFDLVISAGVCGALAPELAPGDLVVPDVVVDEGGGRWLTGRIAVLSARGTLLTVSAVVETAAEKARLWLERGARAIDMESAAILAWAAERGARAAVVRAVSDTADRGIPAALAATVADDGRVRPLRAVSVALSRATTLGALMELRAGTETALKRVAAALATLAREA
ncbi:MAG TPA: hypothetical protein VHZ49_13465 [Methylomirabilota bacterium]|nr:hypothetical protein [Methylomirabilota bacterium]